MIINKLSKKIISNQILGLTQLSKYNKISWQTSSPYNKRWQFKIKHAYYTYPKDGDEHAYVKKPQDSKEVSPIFGAWMNDVVYRYMPGLQCWIDRKDRISDYFQIYVLPGTSLIFYQFYDVSAGFKILTFLPLMLFWIRGRDRTFDPDFKETFLREMIYNVPEITQYFKEETIHVLDYDCEFDKGYDVQKFPEYKNKIWQFFNTDTAMTTGFFKFGDVQSGATMLLKFKTMPVGGKARYQVAEPYYFYDLRAEITHKGIFKEVVLVDEKKELKKIRPFLYLI